MMTKVSKICFNIKILIILPAQVSSVGTRGHITITLSITESFNANISHPLFDYTIAALEHNFTKVILYSKTGFKRMF